LDQPTIDDVRAAKTKIIAQLKDYKDFAGAGIGQQGGRLNVRVNWRVMPTGVTLPDHVGDIEVVHQEVGAIRPQTE
jgi:hypothetical protein